MEGVGKRFGEHTVLDSISLDVEQGEFLTLLGESGSGKTTLLRILAGFEEPTTGRLLLEGQRLDTMPPHRRPIHTVFQSYALFPHMSVFGNVAYGLRVRGFARAEVTRRVEEALEKVRMNAFARHFPGRSVAGRSSAWPWRERWSITRGCCCSMNLFQRWTRTFESKCSVS
jgi:spermidine/putrescine transport system ATP-binding protein